MFEGDESKERMFSDADLTGLIARINAKPGGPDSLAAAVVRRAQAAGPIVPRKPVTGRLRRLRPW